MTDETTPDDIMQAVTSIQVGWYGRLPREAIARALMAERAKRETELATLRAENARFRRAVVGSLRLTRAEEGGSNV